jgi:hypothetical protein
VRSGDLAQIQVSKQREDERHQLKHYHQDYRTVAQLEQEFPKERDSSRCFSQCDCSHCIQAGNPKKRWSDKMTVSFPRRHMLRIGAAFASVVTLSARPALASPVDPGKTVQWDEEAAEEVASLLHHMHHAWNDGDLEFIKRSVAEDGFVGTFELTGDERPVVLSSREELIEFVEKLIADQEASGSRSEASPNRSHEVRATSTFAICTEQCDLIERQADGSRAILPHRGTSALAKTADGWKFVHWHVSQGGKGKVFDPAGRQIG